jgi:DDE superfamily endonuclease
MEEVVDLYAQPYDSRCPVVCSDESPYQVRGEVRQPHLPNPGQPPRYDDQYQRTGTWNRFRLFGPRTGWRHVAVTARRTKQDCAQCLRQLVEGEYPGAEVIRVVLDNLNTHTPGAL